MQTETRAIRNIIATAFGVEIDDPRVTIAASQIIGGKRGDLVDGVLAFAQLAQANGEVEVEEIINDLERGLHRNIPRSTEWQLLARWLMQEGAEGRNYQKWIDWYMGDEWRANKEAWKLTPQQVRNSWPQAFTENHSTARRPAVRDVL